MKYYLVDYENVNSSGLDGVSELSEDSRIVLFYTKNSNKIDLGLFNQVRDMKAQLSVIEVHHGKQALDIQLASYLGYLIGTEPEDTEYYIISKDKGYLNVQSFWPDRKITLCKNLYDDSVIVDEPKAKKTSSSTSRGRRKTTTAKATKTAKAAPAEEKPAAKAEEKPAAKVGEKPATEVEETPATNAFAEAAAIAKAVVEASKARNAANEKKAKADSPKKPAKKTAAKKTSTKKTETKKAETKKSEPKKSESKKSEPKKSEPKKSEPKKSAPKQRISDTRAEVNNEIQKVLSKEGVDGDIVNSTASFVSKNIGKEGYKQTIYRGIIKAHGQKQGLAIYRLIKDII